MKRFVFIMMMLAAVPAAAETFNIEIDYMVETGTSPHSHMPTQAEVDAIVQMFACQGHVLNIVVDDQITHYDLLRIDPDSEAGFFEYDGSADTYAQLKAANFDNTGGGWHYAIFGHQYEKWDDDEIVASGSSGKAERPGDDLVVTLGNFAGETGSAFAKAATLAHEFGHNLGLTHCGGPGCGSIGEHSPILASVMSYSYQLRGVKTGLQCSGLIPESAAPMYKEIDFSHGRMATLNETSMFEPLGTTWRSVDWDCENGIGGYVAHDLSSTSDTTGSDWCVKEGSQETIADYDEWANIVDVAKSMKASELVGMETVECISYEEIEQYKDKALDCSRPTLTTENCVAGEVYFVHFNASPGGTGAWIDMMGSVAEAQNAATPGSALVLYPGDHDEGGSGGVVLNQPIKLYSATSAVIK